MSTSPLQFARSFGALKSALGAELAPDHHLLRLVEFWPQLAVHCGNPSYESYFAEYRALLVAAVSPASLTDCTPDELNRILAVTLALDLPELVTAVRRALTRLHALLGETEKAVLACAEITGEAVHPLPGFPDTPLLSELDRLLAAADTIDPAAPKTAGLLREIAAAWEDELGHLWFDRVRCLFVETNGSGSPRGRMRTLRGSVEPIGPRTSRYAADGIDEVTFEGQLKTAEDPFIGVVYDSLKAVRNLLERPTLSSIRSTIGKPLSQLAEGIGRHKEPFYHAHYEIEQNKQVASGDSIGLAAALIAYTQLLRPEIMRHERFVSSEVAFTGSIAADGTLLPVNRATLGAKLERACLSPVRYVVVPTANESDARVALAALAERFPNRRLRLIAADRLSDVVENHNIVRSERVCIGQFVARKAVRYGRMTKLQVPLLAVLIYVLVCLIYPKAWIWFDWQVAAIVLDGNHFHAVNKEGRTVWASGEFDFTLKDYSVEGDTDPTGGHGLVIDLDNDGSKEVLFQPIPLDHSKSDVIQLYDSKGNLLWERRAFVQTDYPGDVAKAGYRQFQAYTAGELFPFTASDGRGYALGWAAASMPARQQLVLWAKDSKPVSVYLHTGSLIGPLARSDVNSDGQLELFFGSTNNRFERACLLIIDPLTMRGVSPPWNEPLFLASGMSKGHQMYYVAFPETPLSEGMNCRNWVVSIDKDTVSGALMVGVDEGSGRSIGETRLTQGVNCPCILYHLDRNFIPQYCEMSEGNCEWFHTCLQGIRRGPIENLDSMYNELVRNTIVYCGDSVVHHLAAGVDFYALP